MVGVQLASLLLFIHVFFLHKNSDFIQADANT